jgi:hypothetical protein
MINITFKIYPIYNCPIQSTHGLVEAKVICFYRRRDLPLALLKIADQAERQNQICKHLLYFSFYTSRLRMFVNLSQFQCRGQREVYFRETLLHQLQMAAI